MSTVDLRRLIRNASTELGSDACRKGVHRWESEGGRACPHDIATTCGQAVYVCGVCGQTDYGETGGPGDTDCEQYCRSRIERALAIAHKWADPLLAALPHSRSARRQHHQIKLRALRTQKKPRIP